MSAFDYQPEVARRALAGTVRVALRANIMPREAVITQLRALTATARCALLGHEPGENADDSLNHWSACRRCGLPIASC